MANFSLLTFAILFSWIYILFFYGRKFYSKESFFWSSKIIFEKLLLNYNENKFSGKKTKKVCVIIPARNEENVITDTLISVVKQNDVFLNIIESYEFGKGFGEVLAAKNKLKPKKRK